MCREDVGISKQRALFLREITEARITCPNQRHFIGGRMSGRVGVCVCVEGGALCHLALLGAVVLILYSTVTATTPFGYIKSKCLNISYGHSNMKSTNLQFGLPIIKGLQAIGGLRSFSKPLYLFKNFQNIVHNTKYALSSSSRFVCCCEL